MIRNFVLEHFQDETVMRQFHSDFWSPIETRVGPPERMEEFFLTFLSSRGFSSGLAHDLYDEFETWWKACMPAECVDLGDFAAERMKELMACIDQSPPQHIESPVAAERSDRQRRKVKLFAAGTPVEVYDPQLE